MYKHKQPEGSRVFLLSVINITLPKEIFCNHIAKYIVYWPEKEIYAMKKVCHGWNNHLQHLRNLVMKALIKEMLTRLERFVEKVYPEAIDNIPDPESCCMELMKRWESDSTDFESLLNIYRKLNGCFLQAWGIYLADMPSHGHMMKWKELLRAKPIPSKQHETKESLHYREHFVLDVPYVVSDDVDPPSTCKILRDTSLTDNEWIYMSCAFFIIGMRCAEGVFRGENTGLFNLVIDEPRSVVVLLLIALFYYNRGYFCSSSFQEDLLEWVHRAFYCRWMKAKGQTPKPWLQSSSVTNSPIHMLVKMLHRKCKPVKDPWREAFVKIKQTEEGSQENQSVLYQTYARLCRDTYHGT